MPGYQPVEGVQDILGAAGVAALVATLDPLHAQACDLLSKAHQVGALGGGRGQQPQPAEQGRIVAGVLPDQLDQLGMVHRGEEPLDIDGLRTTPTLAGPVPWQIDVGLVQEQQADRDAVLAEVPVLAVRTAAIPADGTTLTAGQPDPVAAGAVYGRHHPARHIAEVVDNLHIAQTTLVRTSTGQTPKIGVSKPCHNRRI
jgi:hypothetical protein